jgi:hypothetical protein
VPGSRSCSQVVSEPESGKLKSTPAAGYARSTLSTNPKCDLVGAANEASLLIGGEKCACLIDTGSMVTSVGEQFYNRYLKKFKLQDLNNVLQVEGAGGHSLTFKGFIEVDITVPGHTEEPLWVPVLVAPATVYNNRVPLIVGTNVLSRLSQGRKPDIWTAVINSMISAKYVSKEVAVYSCAQLVIPPNGIVTFKGRLGSRCGFNTGCLEPAETLPGGIMLMRSIAVPDEDNRVHVLLHNLTSRSIEIPAKQKVAGIQGCYTISAETHGQFLQVPTQTNTAEIPVKFDDPSLTGEELQYAKQRLNNFRDVFAFSPTELGTAKGIKHTIKLSDEVPFKDRPRRIPPSMYAEVKQHLEDMLACGAIRPSESPYSSNVVLVRKKDGSLRVCLDFRKLNSKTIRDAYFLPRIEDTLDSLHGATWFSSLDLQSGYWQIEMEEEDKAKTAFSVDKLGFYECNRMPFGLTNAPATFQRAMNCALKDAPNCFAYLDDIIVFSSGSVKDHMEKLEAVLQRVREHGFKLKPSKCHILLKRISYLGHVVSADGVEADPKKCEAIRNWPLPNTLQELRSAIGFFGYYRRFVKYFAKLAQPLHNLFKRGRKQVKEKQEHPSKF